MRILFVTNFCPHYRVKTFELLAERNDVQFSFFSAADEWYWDPRHGKRAGDFPHEYLRGFKLLPGVRVTPGLLASLWQFKGDAIVKCINGRFALPVSLLIAKLRRKPFVLWTGIWQHPRTLFHRLTFPVTWLVYRWSDAIVVYGSHVKRYLSSLGVDPEKIFVAHHAVDNLAYNRPVSDAGRREIREKHDLDRSHVVLFVGRLEPVKGLDTLLEAFAQVAVDDCQLVLVGDGTLKTELQHRVRELGLDDRVVFLGYIPPADMPTLYSVADILVLPSVGVRHGKELWGLVVNEAMNQGAPVVATTSTGAAAGGLVEHGTNGEVVPERDAVALKESIERVLANDTYRKTLAEGARATIARWDNERMVRGFEAAVRYAVGRRGSGGAAASGLE